MMPLPYTFRPCVVPAVARPGRPPSTPSYHAYEVGQPGDPIMNPATFTVFKVVDSQKEAALLTGYLNRGGAVAALD
jgi:hypothetical protein